MRTFRLLSILLMAGVLFSCQKDVAPEDNLREVSFGITQLDPVLQKDGHLDYIICPEDDQGDVLVPTVAEIVVNGTTHYPEVFYLDDKLYTQSIKLEPGDYTVTKFVLLTEIDGTPIMAIPELNSEFAEYVDTPVEFTFTVTEFEKTDVPVEVLCYMPQYYDDFGFNWFGVGEVMVRSFCFFGDVCLKDPDAYAGSWYEGAPGGLQIDISAITKVEVMREVAGDWVVTETFMNVEVEDGAVTEYHTNKPLCVTYPDRKQVDGEEFRFRLSILVDQGHAFDWVAFGTYKAIDDGELLHLNDEPLEDIDNDGVFDFVLGTCNYSPADIEFAPWQVLPETASVTLSYTDYSMGGYWEMDVHELSPEGSYDFPSTGNYLGWCSDGESPMESGTYTFNLYSSLYDWGWPEGTPVSLESIARVNWLFNHLKDFGYPAPRGMAVTPDDLDISYQQSKDLQHAIWLILEQDFPTPELGGGDPSDEAMAMRDAAMMHDDFLPLPGQFAAVLMLRDNVLLYQLVFILVDP